MIYSIRFLMTLIMLLGCFTILPAQETSQDLRFDADFCYFKINKQAIYLEIYFAAFRDKLTFHLNDESKNYEAKYKVDVEILQNGEVTARDAIDKITMGSSMDEVKPDQQLYDIFAFQLRTGIYTIRMKLTDQYSKSSNSIEIPVEAKDYSDDLQVSDIQLALRMEPTDQPSPFIKQIGSKAYNFIPNVRRIFGTPSPIVYFYAEVYNLDYKPGKNNHDYTIEYYVTDPNENVVKQWGEKTYKKPGISTIARGGVNIITLHSGTYYFHLQITDNKTGKTSESVKRFSVYRPYDYFAKNTESGNKGFKDIEDEDLQYAEYDTLDEKALDNKFDQLKYLTVSQERKIYKQLDEAGKRKFLKTFWKNRDTNKKTKLNEAKQEHDERIKYANEKFGDIGRKGWKTDRGRTYIKYGKPSEIEHVPSSAEINPYEIWVYYEIQGGVQFIFVDKRGFKDYELVHSTHRDEIHDPNWERWVRSN